MDWSSIMGFISILWKIWVHTRVLRISVWKIIQISILSRIPGIYTHGMVWVEWTYLRDLDGDLDWAGDDDECEELDDEDEDCPDELSDPDPEPTSTDLK